jgi:hypothetical protein
MAATSEKNKASKGGKYQRPSGNSRASRPFRTNNLEDLAVTKAKLEELEEATPKPVASSRDLFSSDEFKESEKTNSTKVSKNSTKKIGSKTAKTEIPVSAESETNTQTDMSTKTKEKAKGLDKASSAKKKGTNKSVVDAAKEVVAAKPEVHSPEVQEDVDHPIVDQGSDEVDLRLKKTTKYAKFKINESNRIIKTRHVNNLMKKISEKNLLASNPIIVNSGFEILDGQHRFEAAKRLGLPVFYIVDDYMDIEDIAVINSTSKGWTLDDYLHHFRTEETAKGKENGDYAKLADFTEDYGVNLYNAIGLLSGRNSQPNAELIHKFKRGEFKIVDMEHAIKVATLRDEFKPYAPDFYKSKNFVNSLSKIARHESFDEATMLRKMGQQSERLMKCATVEGYLNSLVDIYNWKLGKDNKIKIND